MRIAYAYSFNSLIKISSIESPVGFLFLIAIKIWNCHPLLRVTLKTATIFAAPIVV